MKQNSKSQKQLELLRRNLNQVDALLLDILSQRQKWAQQIGALKKILNLEVHQPEREKAHRKTLMSLAKKKKLSPAFMGKLLTLLFLESRRVQRESSME